jgi:hypothetical protein
MFHTTEAYYAEKILKTGLKPASETGNSNFEGYEGYNKDYVYVSDIIYAKFLLEHQFYLGGVILEVNTEGLELEKDPAVEGFNAFRYRGTIPADRIKIFI